PPEDGEDENRDHRAGEQRVRVDPGQELEIQSGNVNVDLAVEENHVEEDLKRPGLEQGHDGEAEGAHESEPELGELGARVLAEAQQDAREAKRLAVAAGQRAQIDAKAADHGALPSLDQSHKLLRAISPASRTRLATSLQVHTLAPSPPRTTAGTGERA